MGALAFAACENSSIVIIYNEAQAGRKQLQHMPSRRNILFMDRVNIHGVKIHNTTMQEAVETVLHWVAGDTIHAVYTPNSKS